MGLKIHPVQQGVLGGNLYEVGTRYCVLIDQVLASAQLYPNSNTTTLASSPGHPQILSCSHGEKSPTPTQLYPNSNTTTPLLPSMLIHLH